MSHAATLLAILEREQRKREIRDVRYHDLHEALRRAHEVNIRAAGLIERSEAMARR